MNQTHLEKIIAKVNRLIQLLDHHVTEAKKHPVRWVTINAHNSKTKAISSILSPCPLDIVKLKGISI